MAVRSSRMPLKWCSMALKVTPLSDSALKAAMPKDKSYKLVRLIGRSHFQVSDLSRWSANRVPMQKHKASYMPFGEKER